MQVREAEPFPRGGKSRGRKRQEGAARSKTQGRQQTPREGTSGEMACLFLLTPKWTLMELENVYTHRTKRTGRGRRSRADVGN